MKTPFLFQARALLVAAVLPLVTATAAATVAAESPSLLLQKGIYAEEIERNLDSAIKIYEQIAAEAAASRNVVAQAQYRLAVCYQKKGNKEQAVAALNELVRQFPSETTLSQQARDRLAELGHDANPQTKIHQVPMPAGSVVTVSVSADGRFTAYRPASDPNAVVIQENATTKSVGTIRTTRILGLHFSRDGRRVAYHTLSPGRAIYVANIDGTNPQKIYSGPDVLSLIGWSADPSKLVIIPWETSPLHVKLLDTETGTQTEVAALPDDLFFDSAMSPDGRYLTTRALPPGRGRSTISMIEVASGRQITRVEKDLVAVVGWSEKASRLLFTSLRGGAVDLLALEMKDGQFSDEPAVIRRNVDNMEFEVADEGRLYGWETTHSEGIYVAALDFATGALITEPRLLPGRDTRYEADPLWSKDGGTLMLFTNESPLRLVAVSIATGLRREYPVSRNLDFKVGSYTWAENDSALLVESYVERMHGIYRYDLLSDRATPLALDDRNDHLTNTSPQLSPDGKSVYFLRYRAGSPGPPTNAHIIRKELASAQEEKIHTVSERLAYDLRLSPDGSKFAYRTGKNKIAVVEARGGEARELAALPHPIRSVTWTTDGKRLVFINRPSDQYENEIVTVDIESKAQMTMQLGKLRGYLKEIAVHPDGRQIALRASTGSDTKTLWVMEGFLTRTAQPVSSQPASVKTEEIMGPDNSIRDPVTGIAATLPVGWKIASVIRPTGGSVSFAIRLRLPEGSQGHSWITLIRDPLPEVAAADVAWRELKAPAETDAWLRAVADQRNTRRRETGASIEYASRTFSSRTIAGHRALSWTGEFNRDDEPWIEHATMIYSTQGPCFVNMSAPKSRIDTLQTAFAGLVESVRLP